MSLGREYGILVDVVQDIFVLCIRQVFYHCFQFVADTLYLMIGLIFEEHIDEVGPFLESVLLVVCLDIFVDVFQLDGVLSVCWVVDDDLLSKDMSFESYSQKLEYKLFVHIYVEYRRVVGCLVGDEYR